MAIHTKSILTSLLLCGTLILAQAQDKGSSTSQVDPAEVGKNWSLFSEYEKNGDCASAVPYGWKVMRLDPTKFKTLFARLAGCYYAFYEKETGPKKQAFADTMMMIYDEGIKYAPERAASFWLQKAYALENYYEGRADEAIKAYEKVLELDFKGTDFAYIDRLGLLYINGMDKHPEDKEKAVKLYRRVAEMDPSNQTVVDRLKRLISDPKELIVLAEKKLASDPDNLEYIWSTAQAYLQADRLDGAEKYLEKLVKKSPKTASYWNELAKVQQRERKFRQAIDSYENSLKYNEALKENILNIAVCYRELKNFNSARTYAQRATTKEKGWGRPYMEIGENYKAAVEDCIMNSKGGDWTKLDINDKLVYKLAQDSFIRARSIDATLANEAEARMRELNTLVPTKEDYFFHRDHIRGGKMEIQGTCYGWIAESVPVPTLK